MGDRPFLSIITRTYRRPFALSQCVQSVREQTDQDLEHLILEDMVGMGVAESHRLFLKAKPAGYYVMILDDDDLMATPGVVADLHVVANEYRPDVIVFKMNNAELGILPDALVWQHEPLPARISGSNVAVRRHVWHGCIPAILGRDGVPCYESDFLYLEEIWRRTRRIHWLDRIEVLVSRVNRGAMEGKHEDST